MALPKRLLDAAVLSEQELDSHYGRERALVPHEMA